MAIVEKEKFLNGLMIRNKIGKEGDPDPLNVNGIYQVRTRFNRIVNVKEKFYKPYNPRTELQQANRLKFRAGIDAWHSLSPEEKEEYNKRAYRLKIYGVNLFLREYMLS
jgi:hypothetical protein